MRTYKARGVVLNTVKYGDNSLIANVLTDTEGRQSYIIQGVKSSKGHGSKAAMFQPMFPIEFEGLESSHTTLHRMKEVRLVRPLLTVPFDVCKSTIALFMAEVLYRLVRELEPNSPLFDYVYESIFALDDMEQGTANFHLRFLVGLSRFMGFYPSNEYADGYVLDIREGLFTRYVPLHGDYMNEHDSRLLDALMNCPFDGLASIELSGSSRSEFLTSLLDYFGYHLDTIRSVKSVAILREVF